MADKTPPPRLSEVLEELIAARRAERDNPPAPRRQD